MTASSHPRWQTVGVDEAIGEPSLPFFIERTSGARFPGALPAGESPIASVSYLEIDADPEALSTWLGSHSLPIRVRSGESFSQGRAARSFWAN